MGLDFDPVVLGKKAFRNPSSHGLQKKAGQILVIKLQISL